jgi:hypothetical protein
MSFFSRVSLLFAILFFCGNAAHAMPAQILLLRHAEKPEAGGELSSMGWERARLLPTMFHRDEFKKFGDPVALIAMAPKDKKGSVRPIQTLKYVSDEFHLGINSDYTDEKVDEMVKFVTDNPAYQGKFIVICWNHGSVKKIVKGFGLKKPPKMTGEEFDRAYLMTFPAEGKGSLENLPERLLPTDSST